MAATVKLMLTFQFGIASSFTGIINDALSGNSNENNRDEILRLTGAQSSWLGITNHIYSVVCAFSRSKLIINNLIIIKFRNIPSPFAGSIIYIFQPIGSIISAITTDYFGRKRAMLIVNIPLAIAWFVMYQSNSVLQIFFANSMLGLSVGLMEAPIMTFLGEISEPGE